MAGLGSPQAHGPWVIAPEERTKHEATFHSLKPSCGFLSGEQAKQFFLKSNLPAMVLGKIWSLSDIDRDGKMTMQEFTIAMHLIQNKLKGVEPPSVLPNTLKMTSLPSTFNRNQPTASPQYSPSGAPSGISNGFSSMTLPKACLSTMSGTMTLPKGSGISWSGVSQPAVSGFGVSGLNQPVSSSGFGMGLHQPPKPPVFGMGFNQPGNTPTSGFGGQAMSGIGLGTLNVSLGGYGTTTTNMGMPNGPGIMASSVQGQSATSGTGLMGVAPLAGQTGSTMTYISSVARLKYTQMFKAQDFKQTGFLSGEQVRSMLIQSGLPQPSLALIWKLSDVDKDGQLNQDEFILAMHFVDMAKLGHTLPLVVPPELLTPAMQTASRQHSDSMSSNDGRERSGSNLSIDGRSRSGSTTDDKRTIFTFEDKRKQNFEKGRLELEKRRQDLQDKLKREKEEREAKERAEEERRQRAKMEAEQRRQAELEKQRQQQMEMEREQEALRKQMIQQRLQAQIEAERQRQKEWQKRKVEELLNQKGLEQDIVNNLKQRLKKLEEELATVVGKKASVQMSYDQEQRACQDAKTALNKVTTNRDMRVSDISRVQCDIKEYQQRITALSNERERVALEMNKRDTSTLAEAHGNAMASLIDTKGTIRRLQATQTTMEKTLEERLKEVDNLNNQLKEIKTSVQNMTAENSRLQHMAEAKQREHVLWRQRKEEEERARREMETRRRKGEEETRRQKERELEAMRQEQERQKKDQELRRRMQEAREAEARQKEQQLLNKDKIVVQQQQNLVNKQPNLPAWRTEPEGGGGEANMGKVLKIEEKFNLEKVEKAPQLQEPMPRPRPRAVKKPLEYYRVLYAFEPRNPDEIEVNEDDIVTVDHDNCTAPPGWLRGKCHGKTGLFPANYAEKISEEEAKQAQSPDTTPLEPEKPHLEVSVKSLAASISQQLVGGQQATSRSETAVTAKPPITEGPKSGGGSLAPQGLTAIALYPYRGKKDDMLSFNKNDIIAIKEQQDTWWSGELNGKKGWFPKTYVKLTSTAVKTTGSSSSNISTTPTPTPPSEPQLAQTEDLPILFECVALYTYNGEEGDLSFKEGDVIGITKDEGEWWEGRLRENYGLFPANYVKKKEAEVPVAAPRSKPEIATVVSPYTAIAADQLSLAPGQLIRVTRKDPSGWWEGELQARGKKRQSGIFPANHVKILAKGPGGSQSGSSTSTQQPPEGGNIYEVPSSLVSATQGRLEQVLAMFPYTAQKGDELTFYKGSVFNVMSKDGEWWKGELNGQVGMFPSNYVQSLGDLPASTKQ